MRGLLIGLVLFIVFFSLVNTAQALWWDVDWAYKKELTIINNNDTQNLPINYTINFTIDTTGANFLANGADVRMVHGDTTELHRINLTSFDSATTVIAFPLFENISASSTTTKYTVYYGNAVSGVPLQNESQVYIMFDNFTDSELASNPAWVEQAGSWSAVNRNATVATDTALMETEINLPEAFEWSFTVHATEIGAGSYSMLANSSDQTTDGYFVIAAGDQDVRLSRRVNNDDIIILVGDALSIYERWKVMIRRDHGGIWSLYINDTYIDEVTNTYYDVADLIYLNLNVGGTPHNPEWDDIRIQGTIMSLPTISLGSEIENTAVISIKSPENITYYNNYTLLFEGGSNNITVDTWLFSLNDGQNATIPNATTGSLRFTDILVGGYGLNKLMLFANDSLGVWYNNTLYFTIKTICNATYANQHTCGWDGGNYILNCKQLSQSTYQWDYDNMTYCKYGCRNGICHVPLKTCKDRCSASTSICVGRYISECVNQTGGCFDWSGNTTFCQFGCLGGQCLGGISYCNEGDRKCDYKKIITCDDDNSDGYFDWSETNVETCALGCMEEINDTSGFVNVTCNVHSFGDIYTWRNYFVYYSSGFSAIFNTLALRLAAILAFMLVFGILIGWKVNSTAGIMSSIGILFIGFFIWIPQLFFILILLLIIGGGILFYVRNQEE